MKLGIAFIDDLTNAVAIIDAPAIIPNIGEALQIRTNGHTLIVKVVNKIIDYEKQTCSVSVIRVRIVQ